MQILTEEVVKEVENSISEFKRHDQEYDEERVKGQVTLLYHFKYANLWDIFFFFLYADLFLHRYKKYLREQKCSNGLENVQKFST